MKLLMSSFLDLKMAALVIEVVVTRERLNRVKLGLYAEAEVPERDVKEILQSTKGEIAFVTQPKLKYPVSIQTIEPAAVTKKDVKPHAKAIIELAEAAMTAHTGFGEK